MSSIFREVVNHFNSLKPGTVFTAPEMAKVFNTSSKEIHAFLTPGKYMGVIMKGDIPKEKRQGARVEYMKVRSLSKDEIQRLTQRQYTIDFIQDLKNFLTEKEIIEPKIKDMVVKMIKAQPTTRLTDSQIAESCKVKLAFVSLVKSELQSGTLPKPPVYRTRKKEKTSIDPNAFYRMKGEELLKMKEEIKNLKATNARLIDELTELSAANKMLTDDTPLTMNDLLN